LDCLDWFKSVEGVSSDIPYHVSLLIEDFLCFLTNPQGLRKIVSTQLPQNPIHRRVVLMDRTVLRTPLRSKSTRLLTACIDLSFFEQDRALIGAFQIVDLDQRGRCLSKNGSYKIGCRNSKSLCNLATDLLGFTLKDNLQTF
jgi:hypothetical protein